MAGLRYDVIVIGAGPAGSSAARAAARRGLSVLLVDKRAEVGRPVQCAEYVSRLILQEVPVPRACVAHGTTHLRTHLPSGREHVMAAPGFILHRALFDKHLAIEAARAGADVMLRTTALERTDGGVVVRTARREQEIEAGVVIGADGAHSTVGRWIGQRNIDFVAAAQCELVMNAAAPETEVYFAPEYVGGYAWLFPKRLTANVGVGVHSAVGVSGASTALERFLDRLKAAGRLQNINAVAYTSGFVPVGGLLKGWEENILLAGDAAGCVHPVTGAGILFALISGRLAGETAAEALRGGNLELLSAYQRRCNERLGGPIARGLASRRRLVEGWSADGAELEELLQQNWVAFESYGHDEARRSNGD